MGIKEEILKRLSNAEQDFHANLSYGIKLWKSSSFYYMSKYEVIFDFFLDGVCRFIGQLSDLDRAAFDSQWQIVNDFLVLPCPSNALPPRIIPKLLKVFSKLNTDGKQIESKALLESFLIIALDVKFKNFYKFDYLSYGSALQSTLIYYQRYLNSSYKKDEDQATIARIFDDIRVYVKAAGDDEKWRKAFTVQLPNLCEVVLQLKSQGLDHHEDLLELLKGVYFIDGKGSEFNRIVEQSKRHLFMGYFDTTVLPVHVIAVLIEGYLRAYREAKLDVLMFLKYFLLHVFVDPEKSILSNNHQIFRLTNYVFYLLKKYFIKIDQKLVQDFDFTGIFTIKLKEFLDKSDSSDALLGEICSLICTINEYNPLILEASIIDIVLRAMFVKKEPETMQKYQDMLVSTIEIFVKLNRSENFREELFMKLGDYLDEHNLNEKLAEFRKISKKRKSLAAGETPAKRRKTTGGDAPQEAEAFDRYLNLLYPLENADRESNRAPRDHSQDQWKSLSFAWPDANGKLSKAMLDYVKGLLTKRSFVYWRKMQDYLTETVQNVVEEPSEVELFKLEFAACWICYFFSGNNLVEQTNLFWEKLEKHFNDLDEVLAEFGKQLIEGTIKDSRAFASFLKIVYFYGNYRLLVHYYRPDSIEVDQPSKIHHFLDEEQWKQLEAQVPASEEVYFNRLNLQKLRESHLLEEIGEDNTELGQCVDKILVPQGFEQLRWLLLDRSTNFWFLQQLSLEQKIFVADQLLTNGCYEEIKYIVTQQNDDHSLVEVLLLSVYKRISEGVLADCKSSVARKLPFGELFEDDAEKMMTKIQKLLEKKGAQSEKEICVDQKTELKLLLGVLDQVRTDEFAPERKVVIVGVGILIFADLLNCGEDDIVSLCQNVLNKQLTFGDTPNLLEFLDIQTLIAVFGQSSPLTTAIFRQAAIYLSEHAFNGFKLILDSFEEQRDDRFELVLSVFNYLQKSNANRKKLVPADQFAELKNSYVKAIEDFIKSTDPKGLRKSDPVAFSAVLRGCSLLTHYKAINKLELADDSREIFVRCLDQALKTSNQSSITLLTNALQHKDFLQLDAERVASIVENRWSSFLAQLRQDVDPAESATNGSDFDEHAQLQTTRIFASFVIRHETPAKLDERFNALEKEVAAAGSSCYRVKQYVLRVYSTFAKNAFTTGFSQDVEKTFVRSFGNVIANEILPLSVLKKQFEDRDCLEETLSCFSAVVSNPKLTLVPYIMDNMLEFLSSLSIRKYVVKDGEEKSFYKLHRAISDVLYLLMITRPNYVVNRLPHYYYVFNGLVAAVISFKEDRPAQQPLNSFEILTLSDLLLPLEKIMSLAEKKVDKDLRILAPYILAQIISFIIASKRSTTLHEKISRTVHNICYGLIGLYDKHSPAYLLRTCDEASKNVYTEIAKGFRKYRYFKGKV